MNEGRAEIEARAWARQQTFRERETQTNPTETREIDTYCGQRNTGTPARAQAENWNTIPTGIQSSEHCDPQGHWRVQVGSTGQTGMQHSFGKPPMPCICLVCVHMLLWRCSLPCSIVLDAFMLSSATISRLRCSKRALSSIFTAGPLWKWW
jgi:hypothetical protein